MIRQYDPDWVNGVLQDVAEFLSENDMPASASAIIDALSVIQHELRMPIAACGSVAVSTSRAFPASANVLSFPAAAQRRR